MMQLSGMIVNRPVLSLRTGTQVAVALAPIINPNNLKIEAFYCQDNIDRKQLILVAQDVRDVMAQGIVINDHDVLTEESELVRLQDLMHINFSLLGKPVVTASKQKIGKVVDYAVEVESLYIQKLYVSQSLFKNFGGGSLGIDRSQIIEINDRTIIVSDPIQKMPAAVRAVA
jgi:sporulation protein YlmC with PRC-barrel domain